MYFYPQVELEWVLLIVTFQMSIQLNSLLITIELFQICQEKSRAHYV